MAIKGIGFDIDGTLYNNVYMFLGTLPTLLKYPRLTYNFARVRADIRKETSIEDFKEHQAIMLAERLHIKPEEAFKLIEEKLFQEWNIRFQLMKPFPRLTECVNDLRASGYKLGVLSDFPLQNKLKYLGLVNWDCAFTAEDVNYLKPDETPFIELAKRLELLPKEILYVGNSYEKDIVGASNAGMKTAHFTKKRYKNSIADITFNDYKKLFSLIKKLDY